MEGHFRHLYELENLSNCSPVDLWIQEQVFFIMNYRYYNVQYSPLTDVILYENEGDHPEVQQSFNFGTSLVLVL